MEVCRGLTERGLSDIGVFSSESCCRAVRPVRTGCGPRSRCAIWLKSLESEHLEDGLVSGAVTSRGRTAHLTLEGGERERGLAGLNREMASKIDTRSLRTAGVLRRLADHYEEEARRRDEQAERFGDFD